MGDYWHSNPEVFNEKDLYAEGVTHKENYNFTIDRFNYLKDLNFKIKYIWESDYNKYDLKGIKDF